MQHTTEVRIYAVCNGASCKCFKDEGAETSLVVESLRCQLPVQGVWVQSLGQGTRSHMPQLRIHMSKLQIECATTKTWYSQIYMCVCVCVLSLFSRVLLFATQWTVAYQAPLSMGFSRQEYWSGLPCPPPYIYMNEGIHVFNASLY